jgi:hypothetical protein
MGEGDRHKTTYWNFLNRTSTEFPCKGLAFGQQFLVRFKIHLRNAKPLRAFAEKLAQDLARFAIPGINVFVN